MLINKTSDYRNKIPALGGLRFFAAFFVCSTHTINKVMPLVNNSNFPIHFDQLAYEGMALFFVLSGFVIHYNYSVAIKKNFLLGIYNYFIARFARLYPLFFVCLFLDFLVHFGYETLSTSFYEVILYYLTLTQSWFYSIRGGSSLIFQFGLMPQIAWSVSTEWFFYCLYPLLFLVISRLKTIQKKLLFIFFISTIAIASLATLYFSQKIFNDFAIHYFGEIANIETNYTNSFIFWLGYFSPYSRMFEFILGCITASIFLQLNEKVSVLEERLGLFTIILSMLFMMIIHYFVFNPPKFVYLMWIINLRMSFGIALPIAFIIFCCARYKNFITRFLSLPIIVYGGEISYSLYFFHLPIAEAFSRDAANITSWKVWLADGSRILIAFAAIFGAATISYRLIELPARRWLRSSLMIKEKKSIDEFQSVYENTIN